jgi:hypothetical protein
LPSFAIYHDVTLASEVFSFMAWWTGLSFKPYRMYNRHCYRFQKFSLMMLPTFKMILSHPPSEQEDRGNATVSSKTSVSTAQTPRCHIRADVNFDKSFFLGIRFRIRGTLTPRSRGAFVE